MDQQAQLQIVLSLLDNASGQLSSAQEALANLGTAATDAAATITSSLTPAEEAIATQAQAAADAWGNANGQIVASTEEALSTPSTMLANLASENEAAAAQVAQAWQAEGQSMEDSLAAAMSTIDADLGGTVAIAEEAGAAAGEGFAGYFKKMIVGYGLEQIGQFLSGGIDSAIAAVSKNANQVAMLTDQIDQQKAAIQVNDAALMKWSGTTAEVNAAHQRAAANIQEEKTKIVELTQQLDTLKTTQGGLTGSTEGIVNNILLWIGAHQELETAIQTFMTTLGPLLVGLGSLLIGITLIQVALSVLEGPLLIVMGVALALAAAVAVVATVWALFHTQLTSFFEDINSKFGIVDAFKNAWQSVSQNFTQNLLPALEQLWAALQPLRPYLQALGEIIGGILLESLKLFIVGMGELISLFVDLLTGATKLATFFTTVLIGALNQVEAAINSIISLVSHAGSVGSAIGGAITSALSAVHLATGGIVTQPTFALIGEEGPEAVIPLSSFAGGSSLGGGGGGIGGNAGQIVVNINGGYYLDQGGANMIAQALATQINRNLKLRFT